MSTILLPNPDPPSEIMGGGELHPPSMSLVASPGQLQHEQALGLLQGAQVGTNSQRGGVKGGTNDSSCTKGARQVKQIEERCNFPEFRQTGGVGGVGGGQQIAGGGA